MPSLPPSRVHLPAINDPPVLLIDYLVSRFPSVSREVWLDRFERGRVRSAVGEALAADALFASGTTVLYDREVADEPAPTSEPAIIYRDERIIIVDKPPFIPVTPAGPYVDRSLLAMLRRSTGLRELTPMHRLDRDTSGLVLLTIDVAMRPLYHGLFSGHTIEREYHALATAPSGNERSTWQVATRLGPGTPWFRQEIVPGEVNAITHIELLERRGAVALFRITPSTGRKHQLRVHMASLGMSIVNDRLYPDLVPGASNDDPARALRLVARRLSFIDPVSGDHVEAVSHFVL